MSRRHLCYAVFLAFLAFMQPLDLCARSPRSKSAVLETGQGLEMSRSDLEKIRNNSQDRKSRTANLFLAAVSYSIVDSVMFVSDIQMMENETVNNHWFMKNRQAYENQFSSYVSDGDDETMITFLYFADRKKVIERKVRHLLKKNSKSNRFGVIQTVAGEFSFTQIVME